MGFLDHLRPNQLIADCLNWQFAEGILFLRVWHVKCHLGLDFFSNLKHKNFIKNCTIMSKQGIMPFLQKQNFCIISRALNHNVTNFSMRKKLLMLIPFFIAMMLFALYDITGVRDCIALYLVFSASCNAQCILIIFFLFSSAELLCKQPISRRAMCHLS